MHLNVDNSTIIKFGIWQVEKGALVGKIPYEFIISSSKIWKTSVYNGYLVWDWLIHFAENSNLSIGDEFNYNYILNIANRTDYYINSIKYFINLCKYINSFLISVYLRFLRKNKEVFEQQPP